MQTIQIKRSSVPGKTPNTSTLAIGELALNLSDQVLYSSNGTGVFSIGLNANNSSYLGGINANNYMTISNNYTISGTHTYNNDVRLNFKTTNGNTVSFVQQSDDNFVFYSTYSNGNARAIWSVYANSDTASLNIDNASFSKIKLPVSSPASNATGSQGEIRVDSNYIYVCVSTNTWKRAALSTY